MEEIHTAFDLFEARVDFSPGADFETFLRAVPAKWVVYLMADADGRPVQLLCVKNLRNSLKRRLGGGEALGHGPSKRVDYRELVRRVSWRRVHSAFEADWLYYEAARVLFPDTYGGMVSFRPAWFVHVDPDAQFPRYTRTTDPTGNAGVYVGPVEDKHAAARLIQLVEDSFDLCRYHNILTEAPNGKACAYKEMGRCPAPCDGSVSVGQYRVLVEWSLKALVDPEPAVREHTRRMQQAAAELRFETAAKVKQYVGQLSQLGNGPFRHAKRLKDFTFLSLQHGPREATAKAFVITPGHVREAAGLAGDAPRPSELMRLALDTAEERAGAAVDAAGAERIGVVAHHLFAPKQKGAFLRLDSVDEKSIARAYKDLRKHAPDENAEAEGEGVMKELQSL